VILAENIIDAFLLGIRTHFRKEVKWIKGKKKE
jgi:hypothetical protein